MNARTVKNKIAELQTLTEQFNPDIICITETWLEEGIQNANLGLKNYNIFRRDRNLHGGGILNGVRNTLNSN